MEGIQLTSLLPGINAYSPTLAIGLTILVGFPLALVLSRTRLQMETIESRPLLRTTFLTVLTFWSLLVAYHRAYDLQIFILVTGLVLLIGRADKEALVNSKTVILAVIYAGFGLMVLSLPAGSIVRQWLPVELGSLWIRIILRTSTWIVLTGLALAIALLFQVTSRAAPTPES